MAGGAAPSGRCIASRGGRRNGQCVRRLGPSDDVDWSGGGGRRGDRIAATGSVGSELALGAVDATQRSAVARLTMHAELWRDLAKRFAEAGGFDVLACPRCGGRFELRSKRWRPKGSGKLSVFEARTLIRIQSRYEMDGILSAHGVFLDQTADDVAKDAAVALASSR